MSDLPMRDETIREIAALRQLARERRAVILAHYYCPPEVQEAADLVGDSLGLAQAAAETGAEVIVLCGVHFMAETASILCPEKKVVLAGPGAGCPMADMITAPALMARKQESPGVRVLTYVNSPAAVKAESDLCCTSANAVDMLRSLDGDAVLMTPDQNLAAFAQRQAPEKNVMFWDGYCPVHHRLTAQAVTALHAAHPGAAVAAHPECRPEVLALADFVGSTAAILAYCTESPHSEYLILTEEGVRCQLAKNPGKTFYFPENMVCRDMKKNTLENLRRALDPSAPEVRVPDDIRRRALAPIAKMLGR